MDVRTPESVRKRSRKSGHIPEVVSSTTGPVWAAPELDSWGPRRRALGLKNVDLSYGRWLGGWVCSMINFMEESCPLVREGIAPPVGDSSALCLPTSSMGRLVWGLYGGCSVFFPFLPTVDTSAGGRWDCRVRGHLPASFSNGCTSYLGGGGAAPAGGVDVV